MSPIRKDGGFDLIEPDTEQAIPPKVWKEFLALMKEGKTEQAKKVITDLMEKREKDAKDKTKS